MSFQRSIDNFRQAVQGFARPTLFTIDIVGRGDAGVASQSNYFGFRWNDTNNTRLIRYTCKASAIPSNTFGVIEVPFMGRKINISVTDDGVEVYNNSNDNDNNVHISRTY